MTAFDKFLARKEWVWLAVTLPILWPIKRYASGDPRVLADPVEYFLHYTGVWAVVWLCVVLCLTPLRVLFRSGWTRALNRHRRLTGNAAWAWATGHVGLYWIYIDGWQGLRENVGKPFIIAGLVAWVILSVLAFTSWRRVVRALGGKWWKRLHRLVYLAAALAFFHYIDQEKTGWGPVPYIVVPLLLLEIARLLVPRLRREPSARSADFS